MLVTTANGPPQGKTGRSGFSFRHFFASSRRAAILSLGFLFSPLLPAQADRFAYDRPGPSPSRPTEDGRADGQAGRPPEKGLISESVANAARTFRERYGDDVEIAFLPARSHPTVIYGFAFDARDTAPALSGLRASSPPGGVRSATSDDQPPPAAHTLIVFTESESELLGVPPGAPHALVFDSVYDVPFLDLTVVHLRQEYKGIPILGGAGVAGHFDRDGRLRGVLNNLHRHVSVDLPASVAGSSPSSNVPNASAVAGDPRRSDISEGDAVRTALRHLGADPRRAYTLARSRRAVAPLADGYRLVWDLWIRIPTGPYRVLVDARTGAALGSGSLLRSVDCSPKPRSRVFEESPAKGSPVSVELEHIECEETVLNGEFVRAFTWLGEDLDTLSPVFDFGIRGIRSRGGIEFPTTSGRTLAQTTIYHHATLFHDWFGALGFDRLDRPLPAVANAEECFGFFPCENALYDPLYAYATGPGLLLFGVTSSINFGLDVDVICHEYTHAVVAETAGLGQDFFDPNAFLSFALDEAFADYFSCSYVGDPDVGEYVGRVTGDPPLRDLENDRHWPGDIDILSTHDTGLIWSGALWSIREALSQGGNDPDGVRTADALAYATLISLPSDADFLQAAGALLSTSSSQSTVVLTTVREFLADRGLTFTDGAAPQVIERLLYDTEVRGEIAAAPADSVRLGPVQYELVVPEDGSRLLIELEADGEIDVHLRFGRPIDVEADTVIASHSADGPGGTERIEVGRDSSPALSAGSWFVAIASRERNIASYRLRATLELATFEGIQEISPGEALAGGVAGGPSLVPVQYRLDVPVAADRRLRIELEADRGVNLLVRRGSPVAVGAEGQLLADAASRGPDRTKTMVLDALTVPPLEGGTHYLAVFNRATDAVSYTIGITYEDVESAPPAEVSIGDAVHQGTVAGSSVGIQRLDAVQYTIDVPDDAESLDVRVTSTTDLALYLRRGQRVAYEEGALRFDVVADTPESGDEAVDLGLFSTPALEGGKYYLAVANKEAEDAQFEISSSVEIAEPSQSEVLTLQHGQWTDHVVPGTGPDLEQRLSSIQYSIGVLSSTPGVDLLTDPEGPGNFDIYLRRGRPVQIVGDRVVADYRAEEPGGAEAITLARRELIPGVYFIGIVSRSPTPLRTQLFAYYPTSGNPISLPVEPGAQPRRGSITGRSGICLISLDQYFVDVPATATSLEVYLEPLEGRTLGLLRRFGKRVLVDQGGLVMDEETNPDDGPDVIEGDELRPGRYFFSIRNCWNIGEEFQISVRMRTTLDTREDLSDGVTTEGTVGPVSDESGGKLHTVQYELFVSESTEELVISTWGGACALEDVDLLADVDRRVTWREDGTTTARWQSTRTGPGTETLVIDHDSDPPLKAGRYFIGVLNRERTHVPFTVGAASLETRSRILEPDQLIRDRIGTSGLPDTGVLAEQNYRIDVEPGLGTLIADLAAVPDPNADIDLFGRFGLPVVLRDGWPLADVSSESLLGLESIEFPAPGACLPPGPYFLGIANFSPFDVSFELVASIGGEGCLPVELYDIVSGSTEPATDGGPAVPSLQYCLSVDAGSSGFQIDLLDVAGIGMDLYVRRDAPVEAAGETVTADFRSQGSGHTESISLPRSSVEAGEYFVAVASQGEESAPFLLWIVPLGESTRELPLESAASGVAEPSSTEGIGWLSSEQFTVDVPAGIAELEIELTAATGSQLELHVRRGERVEVLETSVLADHSTSGGSAQRIAIANPPAGTIYVAVRNFIARSEAFLVSAASVVPEVPEVPVRRADCNQDGALDVSDAVATLRSLFSEEVDPGCDDACDSNDDGAVDVADVVATLDVLFLQRGAIPLPGAIDCGLDPTEDDLECLRYEGCP